MPYGAEYHDPLGSSQLEGGTQLKEKTAPLVEESGYVSPERAKSPLYLGPDRLVKQ